MTKAEIGAVWSYRVCALTARNTTGIPSQSCKAYPATLPNAHLRLSVFMRMYASAGPGGRSDPAKTRPRCEAPSGGGRR